SNPALNASTFADLRRDPTAPPMTLEGTVNKAAFLLFLVVVPAAWVWSQVRAALSPAVASPWIMLGAIGGLVVAFATVFKKEWSPITAPVYAAMPFLQGNSTASIVVSGVIVVVAALNLILDFDFIETGVAGGAPKYMEWYGAFGLMVTLIWLYLEILRLLAKTRGRR